MKTLDVDNIVLGYGGNTPAVIQGLSLTLNPGEFLGVVGPNGSGKSTLVRALSRVLAPTHGAVLLDGANIYSAMSARQSAQSIATVPQATTIAFDFTVREIVEMGRTPHQPTSPFTGRPSHDTTIIDEAMKQADVFSFAGRVASTLSGGEQQRVLLARALAQEPEILLLDEPTAHLDLHHQTQALRLVRELTSSRKISTLAVLHDLNLAASYCDRLLLMADGRVIAQGPPADVLTEANVHQAYSARVWVRCHPVSGRPYVFTLPDVPLDSAALPEASQSTIHVICGAGTGAGLLLRLRQLGYHVTAGGLNTGDTDQEAAEMLGIPYARETPFTALSDAAVAKSRSLLDAADAIVITDVPFGPGNLANLTMAVDAIQAGKPVFALEAPQPLEESAQGSFASRDFADGAATANWFKLVQFGMISNHDIESLCDQITVAMVARASEQ